MECKQNYTICIEFQPSNFIIKKEMKTVLNFTNLQYRGKIIQDEFESQFVRIGSSNYFYHPRQLIGIGAYAHVYLGYNSQLRQLVAVKILNFQNHSQNIGLKRFKAEVQALQEVNSIYLIKYIDHFVTSSAYYIVTQLYQKSLRDFISSIYDRSVKLSSKQQFLKKIIQLIHGMITGLIEIHQKGYIHRDLKTDNILMDQNQIPKIIDFGFCMKTDFQNKQNNLQTLGTLPYMAPQAIQLGRHTPQSDIWSLGVIIYEILFQKLPFQITNLHFEECYKNISTSKNQMEISWKKQEKSPRQNLIKCLLTKCFKFKEQQRENCKELLTLVNNQNAKICINQQLSNKININQQLRQSNNKQLQMANTFLQELYSNLEHFKHLKTFKLLQQMIKQRQQNVQLFQNPGFKNNLVSCLRKLMVIIGTELNKGFDREKKLMKQLETLYQTLYVKDNRKQFPNNKIRSL